MIKTCECECCVVLLLSSIQRMDSHFGYELCKSSNFFSLPTVKFSLNSWKSWASLELQLSLRQASEMKRARQFHGGLVTGGGGGCEAGLVTGQKRGEDVRQVEKRED